MVYSIQIDEQVGVRELKITRKLTRQIVWGFFFVITVVYSRRDGVRTIYIYNFGGQIYLSRITLTGNYVGRTTRVRETRLDSFRPEGEPNLANSEPVTGRAVIGRNDDGRISRCFIRSGFSRVCRRIRPRNPLIDPFHRPGRLSLFISGTKKDFPPS